MYLLCFITTPKNMFHHNTKKYVSSQHQKYVSSQHQKYVIPLKVNQTNVSTMLDHNTKKICFFTTPKNMYYTVQAIVKQSKNCQNLRKKCNNSPKIKKKFLKSLVSILSSLFEKTLH